jgi:hypothetical protein
VVGGSEAKKGPGSDLFCLIFFYRVFELPSPRNAQKRDKTNREKIGFGFLVELFCKNFSTRFFFAQRFFSVFKLPSLRNTRKRDKKKVEEKLTSKILSIFLGKDFDMGFLQKYFYGVYELSLPRNAQKRT